MTWEKVCVPRKGPWKSEETHRTDCKNWSWGSSLVASWLRIWALSLHRVRSAAVALVWSLAQQLLHAAGMAKKNQKQKTKEQNWRWPDYTFGKYLMIFILHITHTKWNYRWMKNLDIKIKLEDNVVYNTFTILGWENITQYIRAWLNKRKRKMTDLPLW